MKLKNYSFYSRLCLHLFVILHCISPLNLFPQSDTNQKKIYLESLESNGVKSEITNKVRNQISLNVLRYFKIKYTFIDDSVVNGLLTQLKKQQNLGCDTDKCYRMIEDNLSPDEKISGILQVEGSKFVLTLKRLDVARGGGVVEQKEVSFTVAQLEYFVEEITRSLLDSSYQINLSNAPPEYVAGKIELGSVQIKEVQGVDLKILDFKSSDTRAEGILSELNEELKAGDSAFQKKQYTLALKSYETILKTIDSGLTGESKKSIGEYIEGIKKREENTRTNLYAEKLKEIDERFKSTNSLDKSSLDRFIKEYEQLQVSIEAGGGNKTIGPAIQERLGKLELSLFGLLEKESDSLYDTYSFSEALNRYESLKNKISTSKRLNSQDSKGLLQKIDKKVKITTETGTSYYGNQVKSYCNFAEKENIRTTLKRNKGEEVSTKGIKENIRKAESILRKNSLIDTETLDYYNNVVRIINRENNEIGNYIARQEVGKSKISDDGDDSNFDISIPSIPYEPFLFPGLGHLNKNSDSFRGSVYRSTGFVALGFLGISYLNYTQKSANYQNTSVLPYYFITLNNGLVPGILYSETSLKPLRTEYEQSISYFNAGVGFLGLLYIASLIDYAFTDDFKSADGIRIKGMENGRWNVNTERSVLHRNGGIGLEDRMNMYYKMDF